MDQTEELIMKAQMGAEMRDFCRHPGFKVLMKMVEGKIADSRNEWLRAPTSQSAEEIRLQSKPWLEIETYLKRVIIEGDNAAHKLKASSEEI